MRKTDPSQTGLTRMAFLRDIHRRFIILEKNLKTWLDSNTMTGVATQRRSMTVKGIKRAATRVKPPFANAQKLTYDKTKIKEFDTWLAKQVKAGIFSVEQPDAFGQRFIQTAYIKAATATYSRTKAAALKAAGKTKEYTDAVGQDFIERSFGGRQSLDKIERIATRTFKEVSGVTDDMRNKMGLIFAEGLAKGQGKGEIATMLSKRLGLSRARAFAIASTELVAAAAQGTLDTLEDLGYEEVMGLAEFKTQEDDKVCDKCASLHGKIFTIEEAQDMIPLHFNCRCAWVEYEGTRPRKNSKKWGHKQ
jgi:SPP1 gp7 family putative phage head morphogenesis protein